MNKMKWYQKLLIGLLVVLLSPLILICLISAGICALVQIPKNKKEYKKSRYYLDFKQKFMTSLLYSPEYRFYNSAIQRNLPMQYIKQESNGFEYFIFNDTLYLFPDFEQIDFDAEKGEWQVDRDGDWSGFEEAHKNLIAKLDKEPDLPIKLLIERKMFPLANLNEVNIPEVIYITWGYDEAFENEESPLKMLIPQNSKDLYEMMLQTPDLCGTFELLSDDGNIVWNLYDDIRIELGVDPHDCYLGVFKMLFGKVESGLTHWHPTVFEIYNEVCKIGKRGNVMIVRTFASGGGVLYIGNKEDCPYQKSKRYLFGKLYYLEAK